MKRSSIPLATNTYHFKHQISYNKNSGGTINGNAQSGRPQANPENKRWELAFIGKKSGRGSVIGTVARKSLVLQSAERTDIL